MSFSLLALKTHYTYDIHIMHDIHIYFLVYTIIQILLLRLTVVNNTTTSINVKMFKWTYMSTHLKNVSGHKLLHSMVG